MEYTAKNIKSLDIITAIRSKPGMYIGGKDTNALHHCLLEIVSNSIDEYLNGHGNTVKITLNDNGSVTVEDNARGIPVGQMEDGKEALIAIFTEAHTGGKFDNLTEGAYKVSGGTHGIGATAVNAVSSALEVEVKHGGYKYRQLFQKGLPVGGVNKIGKTGETGTKITFQPDPEVFEVIEFNYNRILEQIKELSFLTSGLKLIVQKGAEIKEFFSANGLIEYVKELNLAQETIGDIVYVQDVINGIDIELAMQPTKSQEERIKVYTNNIPNISGKHITGFKTAYTSYINAKGKELEVLRESLTGEKVRKGLTMVMSIKMADPVFEGQTKYGLVSSEVQAPASKITTQAVSLYTDNTVKEIIMTLLKEMKNDENLKVIRNIVRKKATFSDTIVPGKLAECSSPGKGAELYIVEGLSAGGSMKSARDREFQAILPIKGKIINAERNELSRLLENAEVQSLIQTIGCGVGDVFNVNKVRYEKIILACDADVDGSHIRVLLLTFLYNYMRPLIDKGHVYIANAPLYKAKQGKKITYLVTEEDREAFVKKNGAAALTRFKGLGELCADELWDTTMNPATRTLTQITLEDAEQAEAMFEILMGDDVAPRKDFITSRANFADLDI